MLYLLFPTADSRVKLYMFSAVLLCPRHSPWLPGAWLAQDLTAQFWQNWEEIYFEIKLIIYYILRQSQEALGALLGLASKSPESNYVPFNSINISQTI